MTGAANARAGQRIAWRRRGDLSITPLEFRGRRAWGVKDPVGLAFFELSDREYFLLERLDGKSSAEEICRDFNRQFSPRTLAPEELRSFVSQLVTQGLLIAEAPGSAGGLTRRRRSLGARQRFQRMSNVLCVRFRGIDPTRILAALQPLLGWVWSGPMVVVGMILIASAITLVAVQWQTVLQRLPEAHALLSLPNLAWLPLLLAGVKLLHEIGHGLTCRRYGAECRELGLMLLVFTPTLYCNVSDMWMVRDKWKRMIVSAAGIWVELLIAATCTLLWWFSVPGLFHSLCLNLMVICGVSTLVFNGNPLLRYDGYFLLSDWLEIPNLQQQAGAAWRGALARFFCGIREPRDRTVQEHRFLLLSYGVLSLAYRIVLTFVILWSLYAWLQPHGFGILVQGMAVPLVGTLVVLPAVSAARFLRSHDVRARMNRQQFLWRGGAVALLLGLVASIPVPSRVSALAWQDDAPARKVYATLGGRLESGISLGEHVETGQELARLVDPRLELEKVRLDGEWQQQTLRLQHLERQRVQDPAAGALIPSVRERVRDLENQRNQLRETARRLILRAPCAGVVLPAAPRDDAVAPGVLATWTGQPLDPRNQGCYLEPGTTVCLVGPRFGQSALILVHQHDINLVRPGQRVKVAWRELPGQIQWGTVTDLSALDLEQVPQQAIERLKLPVLRQRNENRPVEMWYQVRVALDAENTPQVRRTVGEARIVVEPRSVGIRIADWLRRTFPL